MAEVSTFDFDVKQKNIMTSAADGKVCPDNQSCRNELGGLETEVGGPWVAHILVENSTAHGMKWAVGLKTSMHTFIDALEASFVAHSGPAAKVYARCLELAQ